MTLSGILTNMISLEGEERDIYLYLRSFIYQVNTSIDEIIRKELELFQYLKYLQ